MKKHRMYRVDPTKINKRNFITLMKAISSEMYIGEKNKYFEKVKPMLNLKDKIER